MGDGWDTSRQLAGRTPFLAAFHRIQKQMDIYGWAKHVGKINRGRIADPGLNRGRHAFGYKSDFNLHELSHQSGNFKYMPESQIVKAELQHVKAGLANAIGEIIKLRPGEWVTDTGSILIQDLGGDDPCTPNPCHKWWKSECKKLSGGGFKCSGTGVYELKMKYNAVDDLKPDASLVLIASNVEDGSLCAELDSDAPDGIPDTCGVTLEKGSLTPSSIDIFKFADVDDYSQYTYAVLVEVDRRGCIIQDFSRIRVSLEWERREIYSTALVDVDEIDPYGYASAEGTYMKHYYFVGCFVSGGPSGYNLDTKGQGYKGPGKEFLAPDLCKKIHVDKEDVPENLPDRIDEEETGTQLLLLSAGSLGQQVFVPSGAGDYATCPLPSPDHGNFLWKGLHGRIVVVAGNAEVLVQNPSSPNFVYWSDASSPFSPIVLSDPPGIGVTLADVGEAILVMGGSNSGSEDKTWIIRPDVCISCSTPSWPSVTSMQAGGDLKYPVTSGCAIVDRDARQVTVIGGTDGTKVTQYDYSALLEDVLGVEGLGFTVVEELPDLPVSLASTSCAAYRHRGDQVLVVVGGTSAGQYSEATYKLKIGDSEWTDSTISNGQTPRSPLGSFVFFNNAITVDNVIYLVGGSTNGGESEKIYKYKTSTAGRDEWEEVGQMEDDTDEIVVVVPISMEKSMLDECEATYHTATAP